MVNGRRKGSAYENHVANKHRQAGFVDAKRHLEFQWQEAKGVDLDNTFPLAVQIKCKKSTPSITAIDEIADGDLPIRVAILKRTQSPGKHKIEVACIDVEAYYAIVKIFNELNLWERLLAEYNAQ